MQGRKDSFGLWFEADMTHHGEEGVAEGAAWTFRKQSEQEAELSY